MRRLAAAKSPWPQRWTLLASVWIHWAVAMVLVFSQVSPVDLVANRPERAGGTGPEPIAVVLATPQQAAGQASEAFGGNAPAQGEEQAPVASDEAPQPRDSTVQDRDADASIREQRAPREEPRVHTPADEVDPGQRFVRVDGMEEEAPIRFDVPIAAHDTRALRQSRTPVRSDEAGPLTTTAPGVGQGAASPTLVVRDGKSGGGRGGSLTASEEARSGGQAGGGGAMGRGSATGSPHRGGDRVQGGATAARGVGGGAMAAVAGGARLAGAPPEAPVATEVLANSPSWWRPSAVRVVPSRRAVGHAAPGEQVASPSSGDGVALRETVGRRADRGGTDRVGQAEAAPSIAPKPSLGEQPEQAEGTSNMIEDLRVALGWEEPDRRTLAPRPSWAGQLGEDSARPTSPQTSLDQLDMDWVAAVDAQGTPLGVYLDQVERVVAARWSKLDLDPHRRAIGVQGQVMLQYRIRASGRVEGLHVSRSSGNSRLDHMALQSVPARLPRFPRDLDESAVVHALVLRYRNPLIPPIGGG